MPVTTDGGRILFGYIESLFSDPRNTLIFFLLAFPGRVLALSVQAQASRSGLMQVFFLPQTDAAAGFSEAQSRTQALQPSGPVEAAAPLNLQTLSQPAPPPAPPDVAALQTLNFAWRNAGGFAPRLRLDLADQPLWLRLGDVRLSCRLPTLAAWRAASPTGNPTTNPLQGDTR